MIPWRVRRTNASTTKQIMSKYSMDTLAAISKLKYFGHTMHVSDCMKNVAILILTYGSGKWGRLCITLPAEIWGTVMKNWCKKLTVMKNRLQCRDRIYKAMEKQKISEHITGSKKGYFLLTQSSRITRLTWDLTAPLVLILVLLLLLLLLKRPTNRFSKTFVYMFHTIQKKFNFYQHIQIS
jgi:hypothetical protein